MPRQITFTATIIVNAQVPDHIDPVQAQRHIMQNFEYDVSYEEGDMKVTDCELVGMEPVDPGTEVEPGNGAPIVDDSCATCGHTQADHYADDEYGHCWHGSGYGFTCSCAKYVVKMH